MRTMLHVSEAWCRKECEMEILRRTERSMVRAKIEKYPQI